MKIAILGTRGIPNNYGGFEQFAEFLSVHLVKQNHEVVVYSTSDHVYKKDDWKGVKIVHCYNPETYLGSAGQFLYDLNCILDSRKHNFDIILQLGYTSSSIWHRFFPKKPIIVTNMDGLEWSRQKYGKLVQKFLRYAEKLAVKHSHFLVADSKGIQKYLRDKYQVDSDFIAYGAKESLESNLSHLSRYDVKQDQYNLLIARMEPENNIEVILDGVLLANKKLPFLVVGNAKSNSFGRRLLKKYEGTNIRFLGAIYDKEVLNSLRIHSHLYFHGHSVGGTNPSLLEAMANKTLIAAHDNIFNRGVLGDDALYFSSSKDIKNNIDQTNKSELLNKAENNLTKIRDDYNLDQINQAYCDLFLTCLSNKTKTKSK